MTKTQAIDLIKLLSALESWGFATKEHLPDYLIEEIEKGMKTLTAEVLREDKP